MHVFLCPRFIYECSHNFFFSCTLRTRMIQLRFPGIKKFHISRMFLLNRLFQHTTRLKCLWPTSRALGHKGITACLLSDPQASTFTLGKLLESGDI